MRAIARAYGDRPLDRLVTGETEKMAYILNASSVDANGILPFSGVGFPRDAVYKFDEALFSALVAAWSRGDRQALESLWGTAEARQKEDA